MATITLLTLPSRRLTHWWGGQCLSPHNLGWSQPIQEIAELAFGPEPGSGEDEPGEVAEGHMRESGWWECSGSASGALGMPLCASVSPYIVRVLLFGDRQNCSSLHIKEKYFDVT